MNIKYLSITVLSVFIISSCSVTKRNFNTQVYKNVGPYLYYYEGLQNRLYGNPYEAIKNLNKSLEFNPSNGAVYYELALAYSNINDQSNAIINLEKAVTLEPSNKYYRNFLGILYMNNNLYEEALNNQIFLVNSEPYNSSYQYQLALVYSQLAQFDSAMIYLNKIEDKLGFLPNVSETKTKIFLQQQNVEKAKVEIDALTKLYPNNPIYLLYRSDLLFREGKDSLGFRTIYEAINLNDQLPISYIELYQRYFESGEMVNALNTLTKIFSNTNLSDNEKANLFYPLLFEQSYYVTQGKLLDSIINIGLTNHPKSLSINEVAYEHYIRRGDFVSARYSLQTQLSLDNDNPLRYDKLIAFDFSTKEYQNALDLLNESIKLFPDYYLFYIYKSLIHDEQNDIEKSIVTLKNGTSNVTNKENLSELLGSIGDMYHKKGDFKSTYKYYNKSLDNSPQNARVLNNYAYYLAENNHKLTKALKMSTLACELEPNNSTYLDTKGWVLFKMEKYEEARDVLRNAIAKNGSASGVINEHYGDALYKTGNKDGAYIYWLKAKELGEYSPKLLQKLSTRTYVP